jgi:hypothetical protein
MKVFASLTGACVMSALIFSPAFATSALPAGKPAGVKQAQLGDMVVPLVLAGALVAGLAVVASQHGDSAVGVISTSTATNP